MQKVIEKLLYILIPVFLLLILITDILSFYSSLSIVLIAYMREVLIIGILFGWFQILKSKLHFDDYDLHQNLVRLLFLIALNFLISTVLNFSLSPQFSETFPPECKSLSAVFVSTIMAITTSMTLVPVLLILRQLIFYKRKRLTNVFFNIFLLSISANAVTVFISEQPTGFFRFEAESLANDISLLPAVISFFILSLRNEWITYLPRKKKIIYSLLGIPLYIGIALLFDFVYREPIPSYSLSLAALTYSIWVFLMIYCGVALVKLFFHLPTARVFDRKIHELNSLYDLGRLLNSETNPKRLKNLITELSARILECNAIWFAILDEDDSQFSIASSQFMSSVELQSMPCNELKKINQILISEKMPQLINDISHNPQHQFIVDWKPDIKTLLAAPIFSNRNQLMGIIYATKNKAYEFDVDDISLIEGIANQAAIALENSQLLKESIQAERMEQELRVAREVQQKLLPQKLPELPKFDVDAFCLTAYEVGGDYYDFFTFADGNPGLIIGDVSGKGTSAALYMAEFKGIIQTLARSYQSPYHLATAANKIVYPNIERKSFVSAIIAKMDIEQNKISYVRAGHPPILHCNGEGNSASYLDSRGIGIGLDAGPLFDKILEEATINFNAESVVLFYTDGVTEARNDLGEEFSELKLVETLQNCGEGSAEEAKDKILNTVLNFCGKTPLHDDLTFVIVRCKNRLEQKERN